MRSQLPLPACSRAISMSVRAASCFDCPRNIAGSGVLLRAMTPTATPTANTATNATATARVLMESSSDAFMLTLEGCHVRKSEIEAHRYGAAERGGAAEVIAVGIAALVIDKVLDAREALDADARRDEVLDTAAADISRR